jgi:hypothetical protein
VAAEGALGPPPLTEHALAPVALGARAEVPGHLPPIPPTRFALVPARVDRDHRRAEAQIPAREPVVGFGIERGVGPHPVPEDREGRQQEHGRELGGVVGRAGGDRGTGDEVRMGVDRGGQLGPTARGPLTARTGNEVARGVPAVEAGDLDGAGGLLGDQAAAECGRDGAFEQAEEGPL